MENTIKSEDINTDKLLIESLQRLYITDMHNMQLTLKEKEIEIEVLKREKYDLKNTLSEVKNYVEILQMVYGTTKR